MGTQQEQVIRDLISTVAKGWPEDLDKTMSYLAENVVYQMAVPVTEPLHGREAIRAEIQSMMDNYQSNRSEIFAIGSSADGKYVFTERLDQALTDKGWIQIPLVAVFELDSDNKVSAWREYMDMSSIIKQQGVEALTVLENLEVLKD
ncbi:MAG: limonene-1,2-epoxide hydrolase family protein [Porticoccaceae bacterium]